MLRITLLVKLTLKAPILSQSTSIGSYGIDSPMARNASGKYYLPGTLVKGRLRQAWEELLSVGLTDFNPPIEDWLGKATANQDNGNISIEPFRTLLHFQDFIDNNERSYNTSYRISIDPQRSAVNKGAYQTIETPYIPGEDVTFEGTITYFSNDIQQADKIKNYVLIGLRWITSFGAERTVGFGRLVNVSIIENYQNLSVQPLSTTDSPDLIDFILKPLSPFCVVRSQLNNNLFESEEVISGGILKGAIATSWRTSLGLKTYGEISQETDSLRPELCKNFEMLRFTHAFPSIANQQTQLMRPVVAPLSLVKYPSKNKMTQLRDVAFSPGPILFGDDTSLVAPSFAIDWKNYDDVQEIFGWPYLQRELRVRTAIDSIRRKAFDEKLFAYETIIPQNFVWCGQIDLSQVNQTERTQVEKQLREILSYKLGGLGKTKAEFEITLQPKGTIQSKQSSNTNNKDSLWVVTLQTPTILCDPRLLDESTQSNKLFDAYSEIWNQISDSSLKLIRFFAQQSLSGGFYLHRRFQPDKPYNPYLLTEPGSVFVLEANPGKIDKAHSYIHEWLLYGLPLPKWAIELYRRDNRPGNYWANCPYLTSNGYGEIAVNLDIHWSNQPKQGEFYAIS